MKLRLFLVGFVMFAAACGSRTGLDVDEELASTDAASDAGFDVRHDMDMGVDVRDALDVFDAPDVFRNDCPDAASTYIYVVSDQHELFSFDPGIGSFHDIGNLNCPGPSGGLGAFSMAVDRKGTAYVLLWDGNTTATGYLFRASTANASCAAIPEYRPDQQGFGVYGMGFATNGGGPSETLYVRGGAFGSTSGLASLDTGSFKLTYNNNTNMPAFAAAELTGTGDGRLFAFYYYSAGPTGAYLGELDKATGQVMSETPVPSIDLSTAAFAFGFWGGDFYFFTGPNGGSTTVTRYRPSDGSFAQVATLDGILIVGAGVSTCAPQ